MIETRCKQCDKKIQKFPNVIRRSGDRVFCDRLCSARWRVANGTLGCQKGQRTSGFNFLGKKHSQQTLEQMRSGVRSGIKNSNWKGDSVSYNGLHKWVVKELGSPSFCEECKRTKPPEGMGTTRSYFQWANISRKYLRDILDWRRLCYPCHKKFDAKLFNE